MTLIAPQFSKRLREPGAEPQRMTRWCSAPGCRNPATKQYGLFAACSIECGVEIAQQAAAKLRRKAEKVAKDERKRDKARLLAMKPISYHLARTQDACNRYVRLRDSGKPCICCGLPTSGQEVDAGHYLSRGSSPNLRFDLDNVHVQLRGCNRGRTEAPRARFRAHLIERIGLERVERLEGPHPPVKWTREGLDELRRKFNEMARELEASRV